MTDDTAVTEFIKNQTFVAFDTETTGMWAPTNRIVEVAAVKFNLTGAKLGTFKSLVNPGRKVPQEVIKIHGITDDMVAQAPPIKPVLEDFLSFCGDNSILVAHNAPFDISFIGCEMDRAQVQFNPGPVLDTVDIYHRFYPGLPSYSLLNLARHFKISQSQEHRALSDAVLVKQLVLNAAEHLSGIENWKAMEGLLTVYRLSAWQGEAAQLPDDYADLQQAISDRRRVEIDYNHPVRSSKARVILPQQVFKLGAVYYINAYCELAEGERTFRLDRILSYKILENRD